MVCYCSIETEDVQVIIFLTLVWFLSLLQIYKLETSDSSLLIFVSLQVLIGIEIQSDHVKGNIVQFTFCHITFKFNR